MSLQKDNQGFTLVEIMLAMTVFAIIMTTVLLSIQNLSITRVKTENRVKLLEELYFFSEQLVGQIKEGGTIDYEEYWNRQTYGILTQSGSYSGATGLGNYGRLGSIGSSNYGSGLYYCVSGSGARMGSGGCVSSVYNSAAASQTGMVYQRYGQYALQFIDYNSNADGDNGDEDGNLSVLDDEDDKDLGNAPIVFSGSLPELYLVNPIEQTRLYFRHVIRQDTGTTTACTISSTGVTNDGCVGNVQILKMLGRDIGYSHSGTGPGIYDGVVDTWILHPDWTGSGPLLSSIERLATGSPNEWVDLFPNTINVKSLSFTLYPQKDPWLSWDARDCQSSDPTCVSPFIHPYARLQMTVGFAWGKRRILKDDDPTISINTTVTLGDRE